MKSIASAEITEAIENRRRRFEMNSVTLGVLASFGGKTFAVVSLTINVMPSERSMILRYAFAWFILMVAAIINGALREAVCKNSLGDLPAHQLSTLTGIILLGVIIWALSRWWPLTSAKQAWTVGFIWLTMTIAFEFLFGHFVAGHPWSKLLHDYNIFAGRVWLLVLIWTTIAPYVFYKLK